MQTAMCTRGRGSRTSGTGAARANTRTTTRLSATSQTTCAKGGAYTRRRRCVCWGQTARCASSRGTSTAGTGTRTRSADTASLCGRTATYTKGAGSRTSGTAKGRACTRTATSTRGSGRRTCGMGGAGWCGPTATCTRGAGATTTSPQAPRVWCRPTRRRAPSLATTQRSPPSPAPRATPPARPAASRGCRTTESLRGAASWTRTSGSRCRTWPQTSRPSPRAPGWTI
mmetsp:Transcript_63627/g.149742  ORF Transcript_63627/g.149742 Transcript_63627/m.149742 type:complete len:228 (-) Transcript_63627:177-860(-)